MNRTLLLILPLISTIQLIGQIETYNFQDYRQAQTTFQSLLLQPELAGNHGETNLNVLNLEDEYDRVLLDLDLYYVLLKNDPNSQSSVVSRLNFSPEYSKISRDGQVQKDEGLLYEIGFDWTKDYFKDYDRSFWGWNVEVNHDNRIRKSSDESIITPDVTNLIVSVDVNPSFRFGWGRLENITNAWHAYRLLNRLQFITHIEDAGHEQINALGQFMDEINTIRFFDSRLGYIARMKMIDDFIRYDLEMEVPETMKYFLELNDMYQFGISEIRFSGRRLSVNIGPTLHFDRWEIKSDVQYTSRDRTDLGARARLAYEVFKPIKGLYQLNYDIHLLVDYNENTFDPKTASDPRSNISLASGLGGFFGYYPTTRTEYGVDIALDYNYFQTRFDSEDRSDDQISGGLFGTMRYWFSPRTNINGYIGYRRGIAQLPFFGRTRTSDGWELAYGATFSHAFL